MRLKSSPSGSSTRPTTPAAAFVTLSQPATTVMIWSTVFGPISIAPCSTVENGVSIEPEAGIVTPPPTLCRSLLPCASCTIAP